MPSISSVKGSTSIIIIRIARARTFCPYTLSPPPQRNASSLISVAAITDFSHSLSLSLSSHSGRSLLRITRERRSFFLICGAERLPGILSEVLSFPSHLHSFLLCDYLRISSFCSVHGSLTFMQILS